MAHEVYPSELNLGTYLGSKNGWGLESQMASWLNIRGASYQEQFVYSGLDLSIGTALSVDVAPGVAIIDGQIVKVTATENLGGLVNAATNYIYLQATYSSSIILSFALFSNISGVRPSGCVLLGTANTGGGFTVFVNSIEKQPHNRLVTGRYIGSASLSGDGGVGRPFNTYSQPKLVMILGEAFDLLVFSGLGLGSGTIGYVISSGGRNTISDRTRRPEITTTGFLVGEDGSGFGNNLSPYAYSYWAWL